VYAIDLIPSDHLEFVGVASRLPSPSLVVLGRGRFWNMNGLLERSSQVDGALLDHLPDVLDPVLLVLNARRLSFGK